MKKKKRKGFQILNARVTATVSVALVLVILGLVSLLAIAAENVTREIKENLGFNVVFVEEAGEREIDHITDFVAIQPYTKSVELITPEQSRLRWQEETGEDVLQVIGVNPFAAELVVKVNAEHSSTAQLQAYADALRGHSSVEDVTMHAEMVDSVNDNLRSITLVLAIVGCAMLFISFMLINNTIRLTIYSRRFIIYTMKLVGATDGFIRRPLIVANIVNGIIAGVAASLLLSLLLYYINEFDPSIAGVVPVADILMVFGALVLAGILICGVTSLFAANRYLRIDYDDMFH
ncbi:MAG: permease-like cell division protein FtsX [Muribaculaceae bacterium]|nr:permease-like cell division protein FtsX [Muribaculaceae bacterium]